VDALLWQQLKAELARVLQARIAGKLASTAGRRASSAGLAELTYDATYDTLNWRYNFDGDYDQNSQVNVSDLTPLGMYFLLAGPFNNTSQQWLVDGDGNELINISDITPLGRHFGAQMSGYNVYIRPSAADYPAFNALQQRYEDSSVAPLLSCPTPNTQSTAAAACFLLRPEFTRAAELLLGAATDGELEGARARCCSSRRRPTLSQRGAQRTAKYWRRTAGGGFRRLGVQ